MKFTKDKQKHFVVCLVISLATSIGMFHLMEMSEPISLTTGFLISGIIGGLYELYQEKTGKGTPSMYDFYWDLIGAFVGVLIGALMLGSC